MKYCATDRTMFMVPSVTMNGGTPPLVTATPVNRPSSTPVRMPPRMPMMYIGMPVMPMRVRMPAEEVSISTIITVPMPASVEPTARSMPPVMMTSVMPSAIMPTEVLARSTLKMLLPQWANHAPTVGWLKPSA